jgi:hypothetical protein
MASQIDSDLLSNRAQENLKADNDFQKFVDVSTEILIASITAEVLTSI